MTLASTVTLKSLTSLSLSGMVLSLMFPLCASSRVAVVPYKDVYGIVYKAFAPAIVGMSGQIHADFLRLLWVLAGKQMRSYCESMGKEDKIGAETFRWAMAKVFNCNKTSVGRAIAFGCATRCYLSVHSLAMPRSGPVDGSHGGEWGREGSWGREVHVLYIYIYIYACACECVCAYTPAAARTSESSTGRARV